MSALRAVAKSFRLRVHGDRAAGRIDGLAVELGLIRSDVEVIVEAKSILAPQLAIENIGEHWALTIGAARARTFDPAFDARFAVAGGEHLALAALDHATRAMLMRAIDFGERARLRLSEGVLRFRAVIGTESSPAAIVKTLVEIARRLATEGTFLPARMLENAAREPCASVRHRVLRILVEEYPEWDESREALELCLRERDPEMLSYAARRSGRDGFEAWRSVAESAAADPDLRITAIGELVVRFPAREVIPVLARVIARPPIEVQIVALENLGALQAPAAQVLPQIARVAKRATPELAIAIARAVVAIGSREAEPILIGFLERDEPELKLVAADALMWCGGAAAIELLRAVPARGKVDPNLAAKSREALARIRARIGPAEVGRLSIAQTADGAGALSLPSVEPGALALSTSK